MKRCLTDTERSTKRGRVCTSSPLSFTQNDFDFSLMLSLLVYVTSIICHPSKRRSTMSPSSNSSSKKTCVTRDAIQCACSFVAIISVKRSHGRVMTSLLAASIYGAPRRRLRKFVKSSSLQYCLYSGSNHEVHLQRLHIYITHCRNYGHISTSYAN